MHGRKEENLDFILLKVSGQSTGKSDYTSQVIRLKLASGAVLDIARNMVKYDRSNQV